MKPDQEHLEACLESAIDLLLGGKASTTGRTEVRRLLVDTRDRFRRRFLGDQELEENHIPSVTVAIRQLEELAAVCAAVERGPWEGSADRFNAALDIFEGEDHYLLAGGQVAHRPLDLIARLLRTPPAEWSLTILERTRIGDMGRSAQEAAAGILKTRGAGKGKGGAPLHPSWARHDFVVELLGLWEQHRPGTASGGPNSKFGGFVALAFESAGVEPTKGKDAPHAGKVIRDVLGKWRARQRVPRRGRPSKGGAI